MKFSVVCPLAALCAAAAPLVVAHSHVSEGQYSHANQVHEGQYNHVSQVHANEGQYNHVNQVHANEAQYNHANQAQYNHANQVHAQLHPNHAEYNNGQYNNGQYNNGQYNNNNNQGQQWNANNNAQIMQLQEATQADNLALARVRESEAQINRAAQLATAYPGAHAQNIRNCHAAASEALARADQAVQRAAESLRY